LPLDVKEIFFFDRYFHRGKQYYKSHFKILPQHKLALEISTTAFSHPQSPKRVFEYFGRDVRLICPLREPKIRSYSLYKHFKRYGMVKGELEEAIKAMPEIIETSRYEKYLKNWIDIFGLDNIHFSFQEHLQIDQDGYIKYICDSIGIPYIPVKEELSGIYNATATPPSFFIAMLSQKIANILRSLKLYSVINFAKKLGFKKYIFGDANPDSDPLEIPKKDMAILNRELSREKAKLEKLLGFEIEYWDK
jgi:hypothetical protein